MIDEKEVKISNEVLSKAKCSADHSTLFYYTQQGLSFRCRHCKGVQIISWEEVLKKHQELSTGKGC